MSKISGGGVTEHTVGRTTDDHLGRKQVARTVDAYRHQTFPEQPIRGFMDQHWRLPSGKCNHPFLQRLDVCLTPPEFRETLDRYGVLQFRRLSSDKLVISCGNGPAIVGSNPKRLTDDGEANSDYRKRHLHSDADTLDMDPRMNPTVAGKIGNPALCQFFADQGKVYKHIRAEAGYTITGAVVTGGESQALQTIAQLLGPGGDYSQGPTWLFVACSADNQYHVKYSGFSGQTVALPEADYSSLLLWYRDQASRDAVKPEAVCFVEERVRHRAAAAYEESLQPFGFTNVQFLGNAAVAVSEEEPIDVSGLKWDSDKPLLAMQFDDFIAIKRES